MYCGVCSKRLKKNQRNLSCTICKKYIHKCCSDLSWKELKFKDFGKYWHCKSCNEQIGLPFNHIEGNNKFKLELFRMFENNSLSDETFDIFGDMSLDPTIFQTDLINENNCNSFTQYFEVENLSKLYEKSKTNVTLLNANIRSLYKNFDSFKDVLDSCKINFDVIGLVETWLRDKPLDYFYMDGYSLEFSNRKKGRCGGACIYINDKIKYHIRNDLAEINHPENVETVFVELEQTGSKNIVVGVIYRPPGQDVNEFNVFIDKVLSMITKNDKLVYLMGDYNINLLNEDVHTHTNDFINIMSSYSFYPSITKPTRITTNSATLIDNIFTNSKSHQTSGIIIADVSDHLPIFITTDLKVYRNINDKIGIEVRNFKDDNIERLKSELMKVEWEHVCAGDDVNQIYGNFVCKLNNLYDKCCPKRVKKFNPHKKKIKSPWISYNLFKCVRRKNRLYKKFIRRPTEENKEKYRMYRNRLNCTLRLAKKNYFSNLLENENNNMRNTWKILNSILRPNSSKKCSEKFVSENDVYTCPNKIASKFNDYFANIGPQLASTIIHTGNDFSSYLRSANDKTCFFKPTNVSEIIKIIRKMGSRKSAGHDNINVDLIKSVANEIAEPLSIIFNVSLCSGIFPDEMKIAKVVPIYKKDNPEVFGNYRPVSVLPCISKILERIVYNRSYDFLSKNNILYKKQYGFRTNHSTYMAVIDFINDVSRAIDDGMNTVGIFMDLSKAFDTIDHDILLAKLHHYGFRGISQDWFRNYLSNRKQFVVYNSGKSQYENIKCGVPQGSILGPLLFILYMNDICHTSSILKTILFADDTTCFYSHKNVNILCETVNKELKEICNWFKANKLSLNAKKTNLMFLGTRFQTKNIRDDCNVYLDGCRLTRVTEAKFLGITIDENLTWKRQIDNVCKSCARSIGVLNKVKVFLPQQTLYKLYCTLILPYLNYGLLLWGDASKLYLNKVFKLQKRALRVISNSSYLASSEPLFKKFKVLNIFNMYKKETAIFMYKYKNNMLPSSFDGLFVDHKSNHNYNTRNNDDFQVHMYRIENILNTGPKIWNNLPKHVKCSKTISQFKRNVLLYFDQSS